MLIIDVEVQIGCRTALIVNFKARFGGKGHREPAVECPAISGAHLQGQAPEVLDDPMSNAEEIPDWAFEAREAFSIPPGAQDDLTSEGFFWAAQCHPDMPHTTCTFDLRDQPL